MKPSGGIRNLLSVTTDAVVLVDSKRKVSFMNLEAEKLTGFNASDATGKDLWKVCIFVNQNTRKPVIDDIDDVLSRDGYFDFPFDTVIIHRDGDERLIRGRVILSDDSRPGSNVIEGVVFRNVSSRWMIDTAIQKSQKAETIRILAAGITGRLNDLLTVLLARLSGISINHTDTTAVFRAIRESKQIIGKISSMVSSLSPEESTTGTGKDICLVRSIIRSSLNLFSAAFPGVDIKLAYPDRTGYAGIPHGLVEQVIVNLLMNSGEAVRGNGTVMISACRIILPSVIKPVEAGSYILITVRDDGCGISEENLTRIFDPYFSTKRQKAGLGLSAVYSIVNTYKGYIIVDSVLGSGTLFSVYLPAAEGIVTETAGDTIPGISIMGFTKDEKGFLKMILESIGCMVVSLPEDSTSDAAESAGQEDNEFNLLLTEYDYYMSEIDRLGDPGISGNGVIAVINESRHVPDNHESTIFFVQKPLKIENISEAVAFFSWMRPDDFMKVDKIED